MTKKVFILPLKDDHLQHFFDQESSFENVTLENDCSKDQTDVDDDILNNVNKKALT